MSDALSNPPTPNALNTGTTCVQFAIPSDSAIRAAWLDFAAYLGDPENWQKSGVVDEYECAALIASMIENGLNTPCETQGSEGAMEFISETVVSDEAAIVVALPAATYAALYMVGKLTAIGTVARFLKMRLSGDNGVNRYSVQRITSNGATLSSLNATGTQIDIDPTGIRIIAPSSDDVNYSPIEMKIFEHNTGAQRTIARGSVSNMNDNKQVKFDAVHNVGQAETSVSLYVDTGNISGSMRLYGIL